MQEKLDYYRTRIEKDIRSGRLVLPTLPDVALQIRRVIDDENSTARDISEVILTDAAVTTRLLAIVNSPLYRGFDRIVNVHHAVSRLGRGVVRDLVISVLIRNLFQSRSPITRVRLERLWHHSVHVAGLSYALADEFTTVDPQLAMLAGLIHDVGSIPLISYAEQHPDLLVDSNLLTRVVEIQHAGLGAAILERWNLDPQLVTVAREHEMLNRSHGGPADCTDVVMVANLQYHFDKGDTGRTSDPAPPAWARLGLQPDIRLKSLPELVRKSQVATRALAA